MTTRFRLDVGVAAIVMAAAAVGCSDSDQLGTVGVALTATDASGAQYRLTPQTRLAMAGATFYDEFSLDGDSAFVRVDVPPGDYAAELRRVDGGTTHWPLERRNPDGTTETVLAVLTTPMPAAVTITEGSMTNLVLRFQVPGFGPITFAEGSANVSIEVAETAAGGVGFGASGALTVTSVTRGATRPPVLDMRLPDLMASVTVELAARVTGPWVKSSAADACAPVEITTIQASHPGLRDLLSESSQGTGASADLCVSSTQQAYLVLVRAGTALTPTFSDLGSFNLQFLTYLELHLPAPVFDGHTLDLDPAVGNTDNLAATLQTRVSARPAMTTTPRVSWYNARSAGNLRLSLVLEAPPMP